jgi:hypothetical protein
MVSGSWEFQQSPLPSIGAKSVGIEMRTPPTAKSDAPSQNDRTAGEIWGFHGGDYEECRLLGYENPFRTSQETHGFSATESIRLMLCKIWGSHGSNYEERRLLGYKNPVRTSQETHDFSATQSSQLMLCKVWSFHCSYYEEYRLLGCVVVCFLWEPTLRKNASPPSSGWQESAS